MKKLMLVLVFLASGQANAKPLNVFAMQMCHIMQQSAEAIMESRQKSVSMNKIMQATNNIYKKDRWLEFMQLTVLEAYSNPLHYTPKSKTDAVVEFGNGTYLACLKGYEAI